MNKNIYFVDDINDTFTVRMRAVDGLPFTCISGSYNVFKARLFSTSYDEFLLIARNNYGAELKGRDGGYIIEFFLDKTKAEKFCRELNRRMNLALDTWNRFNKN